jgi:hypothetical protein
MKTIFINALLAWMLGTNPSEANQEWGIGLLTTANPFEQSETMLVPREKIDCAHMQGGPIDTHLMYDETSHSIAYTFQDKRYETSPAGLLEIAYEAAALMVYAEDNGHYAIKAAENDGYLWVPAKSLQSQGYRFMPWADFLPLVQSDFHPLPTQGLNLRKGPSTKDPVIAKLLGENYLIHLTGARKGFWMEAIVEYWPEHPCNGGESATKNYTGWIKALDDKGFPNIWYFTRGC